IGHAGTYGSEPRVRSCESTAQDLWGGPHGPRGSPWTRFSPMTSASSDFRSTVPNQFLHQIPAGRDVLADFLTHLGQGLGSGRNFECPGWFHFHHDWRTLCKTQTSPDRRRNQNPPGLFETRGVGFQGPSIDPTTADFANCRGGAEEACPHEWG